MSDEVTNSALLLEVTNLIDEVRIAQEEMRNARQELANHETSVNPHGLTNPNSKLYATLKKIVLQILAEKENESVNNA